MTDSNPPHSENDLDDVGRLAEENRKLVARLQEQEAELGRCRDERNRLEQEISLAVGERDRFLRDYIEVERRNNDLANLYVATYQLHSTFDEQEVAGAIAEIVVNLIGCEQFGLFDLDGSNATMRPFRSVGLPASAGQTLDASRGVLARAVATGEVIVTFAGSEPTLPHERGLTACVPLKVAERVSGAILLFELLPQKGGRLASVDSELLDLLASQAGPALHASRIVTLSAKPA